MPSAERFRMSIACPIQQAPSGTPPTSSTLWGADASASLAPVETAVNETPCSTSHRGVPTESTAPADFRHSGWEPQRRRVIAALRDAFGCGWSLQAFLDCGDGMWILRSKADPERYKAVANHCHSRWCVPCYRSRAFTIRNRVAEHLSDKPVRFVTLTLRHGVRSLAECLDHLYTSFRALRSKPLWKNRVSGGVAFLEVKRGRDSGLWHPHLHCLIQGRYIPQAELSQTWLDVTGDSTHVDIRLVHDRGAVIRYVTEYVTKTASISAYDAPRTCDRNLATPHESLVEAMRALRGRRTIISFGEWRRWRLLAADSDPDWECVGSLAELEHAADAGDHHASAIIDALKYANDDPDGVFRLLHDP